MKEGERIIYLILIHPRTPAEGRLPVPKYAPNSVTIPGPNFKNTIIDRVSSLFVVITSSSLLLIHPSRPPVLGQKRLKKTRERDSIRVIAARRTTTPTVISAISATPTTEETTTQPRQETHGFRTPPFFHYYDPHRRGRPGPRPHDVDYVTRVPRAS